MPYEKIDQLLALIDASAKRQKEHKEEMDKAFFELVRMVKENENTSTLEY